VARVSDLAPPTLPDADIVSLAIHERRVVLTQDLDFSRLVALSGAREPSLISLRLSSSKIEHVNSILLHALPKLESIVPDGTIVTIEDHRMRVRHLPLQ
jgi:predicted nuclease of predicted toxin-antitoxin system